MSKGTCTETYQYEYFSIYYNSLHNIEELNSLKEFLKYTESNIEHIIKEFNLTGHISKVLLVKTKDGFETKVLDNDVIIFYYNCDDLAEYIVLDYDDFESIYKVE